MAFAKRGKWGTKSRAFRVNHGRFYKPTSVTVLGVNSRKLAATSRSAPRSQAVSTRLVAPVAIATRPHKSMSTAYILWLVTGLVGGHRYYLGRPATGFLMTITLGGFGVWWMVDAFLIPGMLD